MRKLSRSFYLAAIVSTVLFNVQCKNEKSADTDMAPEEPVTPLVTITKEPFGTTKDSIPVDKYIMKNEKGMQISVITYGGAISSWTAPDKNGEYKDIVLGFDSIQGYQLDVPYFGALIGRYGNRIAKGKFTLDGTEYTLATNDGQNHLHGGLKGFDKVVWNATEKTTDSTASLVLTYLSKDMEEGYPGNLNVTVTYTLDNHNELNVLYEATTDKKTVLNLTQHTYFNLTGDFSKNILGTEVSINADQFLPVDATLIPTGELRDVSGTPFDFRQPKALGKDIGAQNEQLKLGGGYDHCWVLNDQNEGMRMAASAYDPGSGRLLEVYTDQPGIQLYTGNFLDGTLPSKQGGTYGYRSGFCLETQHYPDSPNQKAFPSVVLNPGAQYKTQTTFKFSTK